MPYDGYEPIKIEKFGGLNTLIDPTNLPIFASPDCQDVEFIYGLVRTRPGIVSQFTTLANNPMLATNPTVNYLKTYITNALAIRMLALDSLGILWKENPQGTLGSAGTIENTGVYANSVSLFGREYQAIGDGKFGASIPRQFDDVNFDRVSQVGPGQAPTAGDENISVTINASPNGLSQPSSTLSTISESASGIFTITVAAALPAGLQVGDQFAVVGVTNPTYVQIGYTIISVGSNTVTAANPLVPLGLAPSGGGTVFWQLAIVTLTPASTPFVAGVRVTIAGAGVANYNGTWTVRAVNPGVTFTVGVNFQNAANSGNGTVVSVGSLVAGLHQLTVVFVTRQGYITAPAPPNSWVSAGGKRAAIVNIPIGPSNVVQRILLFTASGGGNFFYQTSGSGLFSGDFRINDNTTTAVTVDFSDTTLLDGTNADQLFRQIELGECSGVISSPSGSRLLWFGERKKDTNGGNFVNLTFDGGFTTLPNFPLGWTPDPVLANRGGGGISNNPVWGGAYRILGDGASAIRGKITQTAYQDYVGNPILQPNTAYSIRARVYLDIASAVPTQGTLHINLQSTSGAFTTTGLSLPANALTSAFTEFTASILTAQATIPTDILLQVYVDGTLTFGAAVGIDNIEFFPTTQPYSATIVRVSKSDAPEVYDGFNGFLDVAPSNGQATRTGFVIRNNIYLAKERSLYVTQDDGENEAALWSIQEVSSKVGTLSVRGVGLGDEWAIIAGQSGVYYFDGGEPQKLSQEIQPTWDQINWAYGYLIDVKVDTQRKRVYIDVPFGTSTVNNKKLTLDYTDGFSDPNPTNTVNIAGIGRKWVPWTGNVVGNSQNFILRADGTQPLFIGNRLGNGKIYSLDLTGTVFTDDGAKINDYWQSGYFQDTGRLDFGYLTANVLGSGSLGVVLRKGDQGWLGNARGWFLSATGFRDLERQINVTTERLALRMGSVGVGDNFSLQGITAYARPSVTAPLRGINA